MYSEYFPSIRTERIFLRNFFVPQNPFEHSLDAWKSKQAHYIIRSKLMRFSNRR